MSRQTGGCCYEAKLFGDPKSLGLQIISTKFNSTSQVEALASYSKIIFFRGLPAFRTGPYALWESINE
jgi:hypothetical protein